MWEGATGPHCLPVPSSAIPLLPGRNWQHDGQPPPFSHPSETSLAKRKEGKLYAKRYAGNFTHIVSFNPPSSKEMGTIIKSTVKRVTRAFKAGKYDSRDLSRSHSKAHPTPPHLGNSLGCLSLSQGVVCRVRLEGLWCALCSETFNYGGTCLGNQQ